MDITTFTQLITYIVDHGIQTMYENTDVKEFTVDYCAIFSRNEDEYNVLFDFCKQIGKEIDKQYNKTGHTFLLDNGIKTSTGVLQNIKIRKHDQTRPQRGAPDFMVSDYQSFKEAYLHTSGNFTLLVRKEYEMIEVKGIDVLVYIPNKSMQERISQQTIET